MIEHHGGAACGAMREEEHYTDGRPDPLRNIGGRLGVPARCRAEGKTRALRGHQPTPWW